MNYYERTLVSIPGRDIRRPQPTREQRIRKLEQYLFEMAPFSFTTVYQQAERDLAALKAEG